MEESSRLWSAHICATRTREWVRDSRAGVRTVSKYTFLVFIFFFSTFVLRDLRSPIGPVCCRPWLFRRIWIPRAGAPGQ